MRKKLAMLFAVLPLALSGCAVKNPAQLPLRFRTALLQAGGCTFTAAVTADYGDTVTAFTLDCVYSPQTGAELTLLEPDSIAGIHARVDASAAFVTFDETQLAFDALANGTLAPLAAPYVLGRCWSEEYIDTTGTEDGLLRTTYRMGYEKQELIVDVWFSEQPLAPVRAEISYGGRRVLCAQLSDFVMQQTEGNEYENTQTNLGGYLSG